MDGIPKRMTFFVTGIDAECQERAAARAVTTQRSGPPGL